MVRYEGLFIFDSDLSSESLKGAAEAVCTAVQKLGGSVTETQEWGKRKLAYPVKKRREGSYLLILFSMKPEAISRLQTQLRLNERVLKFLITRCVETPKVQEASAV